MSYLRLIPLLLLTGCVSFVKELKKPPFPYALMNNERAVALEVSVPNQAGDAIWRLKLGFWSHHTSLLPCATNQMYIVTVSDNFKLGQNGFDTTITESLETGWTGQPPPARFQGLFSPKEKAK